MKKAVALTFALGLAMQARPATAQEFERAILRQLQQDGYSQITTSTTLLGRVRFVARGAKGQREIVLNPRTGEVLRDVWKIADASSGNKSSDGGYGNSGSSSGNDNDDDRSDDDSGGNNDNDGDDNDNNNDSGDNDSGDSDGGDSDSDDD